MLNQSALIGQSYLAAASYPQVLEPDIYFLSIETRSSLVRAKMVLLHTRALRADTRHDEKLR